MNQKAGAPPTRTLMTYSELLVRAMNDGLGMDQLNKNGRLAWEDVELAVAVGCVVRSIQFWKSGRRCPSRKSHGKLKDVFSSGMEEEAAKCWRESFDTAYEVAKLARPTISATYVEFVRAKHHQISGHESDLRRRLTDLTSGLPVLIGPTYLDFILYPVTTDRLGPDLEFSTLQKPKVLLGGSSAFIGRYINRLQGSKPDLITTTPRQGTPLSDIWWKEVGKENWIGRLVSSGETDDPSITFALRQARDGHKTMFTYPSGKDEFGWAPIRNYLEESPGKVLHFSGIVKTGLRSGFIENLEEIVKNNVTVIDHGRFTPDQKEGDYQNLIVEALNYGLFDYHITSLRELAGLYDIELNAREDFGWDERKAVIDRVMEKRGACERTNTIVRDYDYSRRTTITFLISFGDVILVEEQLDKAVRFKNGFVYAANKFNAAFISRLHEAYKSDESFEAATLRLVEDSYETLTDIPKP